MSDNNQALEGLKRTILQNRLKHRMASHAADATQRSIPKADRDAPLPLSWAQQRLWFLDHIDEAAGAAYHVSAALRLTGTLDRAALKASLDRIVARHENLRTTFVRVQGMPRQVIAPADCGFALVERDLSDLGPEARDAEVAALSASEARAPFDLARGPLIRGQLLRLGEREHVLLVNQHHIISDGWSTAVLVKEVSALYTAFHQGQPDPLPPLPIQYADFAAWQRQWLQGDALQQQIGFWRQHLGGAPALLELPTDRPRPPVPSYAGGDVEVLLTPELSTALRALSQRHGITLFMTLLAAWSVLLSRLSGQDEVVVGTPVANRQRAEVEPLIGFFVNTLALRVDLSANLSVTQLLAQIKATTLGAYQHQDLPFDQVVEALQPTRNPSYSPVFQALLSMNSAVGVDVIRLPGLELESIGKPMNSAHFDLDLGFVDTGHALTGKFTYALDLFDRASVVRFSAYLTAVLQGMVADDTQSVDSLSLLSLPERELVLHGFNATQAPYPQDRTIHALFEAQVEAQPDAMAVEYAGVALSYGELNRRANAVAHRLIALGVKPDDRVAICTERSLEMVIGLMGILKAGGAYVPLDPAYPPDRLAYMLEDSAPNVVLTQAELRSLPMLASTTVPVLVLDGEDFGGSDVSRDALVSSNPTVPGLTARHVAYVIYTSGSTGQPKGVMVEHRSAVNFWQVMTNTTHRTCAPNSRVALNAAFSFDMSLKGLLQLLSGHCVVLIPQAIRASGPALLAFLEQGRIDAFDSTPSQLEGLLAAGLLEPGAYRPRNVLLGGEPIGSAMWERLKASTVVGFHNMYGPTEATVDATIENIAQTRGGPVIGKPLGNARIYLLDARGQPVPVGVAGEIHIGGVGVARGYLHRPELTAERFLADPFAGTPDARMYKTGDLARWLPDGNLEYLGRNDFQVKVRGFRIELGEIEARLLKCAGVREAVVLAREDNTGDKRLVAYIVATEQSIATDVAPTASSLREALLLELPEYMVPSAFVALEKLPLNPNGKLDRKALPAPDQGAVASRAYEAPIGEIEQAMATIWQELLNLERVGRNDNFFELGGHSLLVINLIERLRQAGLTLEARAVFMTPTLSALATATVSEGGATERGAIAPCLITPDTTAITPELLPLAQLTQHDIDAIVATVPGGVANVQDIYPLAPLQEGILFHHLLEADSGGDTYLLRTVLAFDGRARLDAFLAALDRVVARHDILRSAVHWQNLATPVQVVHRHAPLPVHELDFPSGTAVLEQLLDRTDPRCTRIDVQRAPILGAWCAFDPQNGEWLLALLNHHLMSDHIAMGYILAEIQAVLQGQGDQLPASLPYRDFIARTLAVPAHEHEAYFRAELADVDEPTAPFGVLDVQADAAAQVDEVRVRIDEALAQRLREQSRLQGVSPAVVFHLAWARVLAQCSGREDVVFGTVLSGRLQEADTAQQVVGMFINTLPVRIALAGSVVDAVRDTHRRLATLLAHEQAPLALAQRCSGIQAPLPLFTTLLNYRHSHELRAEDQAAVLETWEGVRMIGGQARTNYPLTLSIDDLGQGFGLTVWSAPGMGAERIAGYVQAALAALVDALADAPQRPVRAGSLLSPAERGQVVDAFNDTRVDYAHESPIHALFEAHAAMQPQAVALECDDERLSYDALNQRANQLAHRLIELGVAPEDRVAICAGRSPDTVVAMLAVLKAGAAYVPVDPSYPAERLAYVLGDSAPTVVLVQASLQDSVAALVPAGVPLLVLEEPSLTSDRIVNPCVDGLTSRDVACVLYTSGSTGQPKGVMVEHRGVVNLATRSGHAPAAGECISHCSNVAFDATTWEVWAGLLNGARLLVVPPAVVMESQALDRALADGQVGTLFLTVGLFNEVAPTLGRTLAGLDCLMTGGDVMDPRAVERVFAGPSAPRKVVNCYGPTEATTFVTTYTLESTPTGLRTIPIGRPIANARIYLLDAAGEPVPVGVTGEIHIGGDGVARGYLNRPDLTAERFLADPFAGEPGARMYKTGDLGRWLPDGNVEYLGRNDFQVKIRGFRIELGEVEATLAACAGVREAVVLAREDSTGDKRLVAYVVAEDADAAPSVAALREQLSHTLPEYMVPSAFVPLAALPLTPNGKLDRKALPAPELSAMATRAFEAPEGDVEHTLAMIWQSLLGVEQVGRHDHFFELGGHSLLAVRLVTRVRAALGVEVTLREVFAQPTLAQLARTIAGATGSQLSAIVAVDRDQPLPLSWAQQRLWFLDQLDEAAGAAYHIPAALRLRGVLNVAALRASLDRIVARHEILRTTFVSANDEPRQVIAPADVGFTLLEHDLRGADDADSQLGELGVAEARAPFDLSRGPLIRGRLLRLADDDHVLLVTQHHIVSDGGSIGVLVHEFGALYTALCAGEPDPLPPLPIQYADFAAWQRQWLQGEALQQQVDFWRGHLSGAPALLELPTDRPRPPVQSYRGDRVAVALSRELTAAVHALSQRHGMTVFMTLLAAWSALLSRLSGQTDIVVGSPAANRQRAELEPLIGLFVNTMALRVDLSADPSVAALLAQVKATTLGAYAHQDLPFEQVVEAVQPERSLAYNPVFQAWLNLNHVDSEGEFQLPGLTLSSVDSEQRTGRVDLSLALTDTADGLVGSVVYSTDLFDRATVERLRDQLQTLVAAMVADDTQPVGALSLLSLPEREQVLHGFNATQAPYPQDRTIHALFEAQVEAQPDAMAVEYAGVSLSYGELNARANAVAHRLIALGVRPDDRVAICTERSLEMVIGLLGILKAGGAYVPLDPAYPPDRLAYMLEDSAPNVVLTQAELRSLPMLASTTVPVLVLDGEDFGGSDVSRDALVSSNPTVPGLTARHVAYVIYTSGSTGQPKGVMVEHRSAVNFWQVMTNTTHRTCAPNSRVALNAAFSFDMSLKGLLQLLSGHCVVLIPQAIRASGPALLAFLEQGRIDAFDSTPSQLEGLLAAGLLEPGAYRPRNVLLGGEPIGSAMWERLKASTVVGFHNMYGPTEATVDATIENIAQTRGGPVIGKPLGNARIYLLDARGQPVPVGVAGEIHIGGVGVARGYLLRPELTAERFLADPFAGDADARMYKTGDLARWLPDGNLEYLGRNDFQVKVRGFRIELGEIEARLLKCVGVREAVVLAREDNTGDKRLVAYIVATEQSIATDVAPTASSLREALLLELPEYMVPSAFVALEKLPLNPNGKLDRKALPAPDQGAVASRAYEAPVGEIEQAMATIWQELLNLERVGRNDHFFELGGHSLLVMQLVIRMREQFNVDIPLRTLFERPTFGALAEAVVTERLKLFSDADVVAAEDELNDLTEEELLAMLSSGVANEY